MLNVSRGLQPHHGVKSAGPKITTALGGHTRKECRKAVVVRLAVGFEWVLMTLSALQANTKKHLSRCFCEVGWLVRDFVEICLPILINGTLSQQNLTNELAHRFIFAEGATNPVGECPHVVRHPSETGLWFCLLGLLVGAAAWHTAVVVLPVIAMLSSLRVTAEEHCLLATHGDLYRDYRREVPRSRILRRLSTIVG